MSVPQPLTGFRVVEMGTAIQGPAAGVYLSDMGAEVIKIEPPLGDASRFHRGVDNHTPPETPGAMFIAGNRGKRSVCLDIHTEIGIEVVRRLLRDTDVFMSNYRAPFLRRVGLDYETVGPAHPRLIYAVVNGFGPLGPDADRPMVEGAVQARGGLASLTGPADGLPTPAGATIADAAGAMQFALAIVTGLLARERDGQGQYVATSSLGAQLWLQSWEVQQCLLTGVPLERAGSHMPNIRGPWGVYEASDGGLFLSTLIDDDAWRDLFAFAELPEVALDPNWDNPAKRMGAMPTGQTDEAVVEIRAMMRRAFANRTTTEWEAFFRSRDDLIVERVQHHGEVVDDPQTVANEYVVPMDFDGVGASRVVGNLVGLSRTPGSLKGPPPGLGEATEDVMCELGFAAAEIATVIEHTRTIRDAARGG